MSLISRRVQEMTIVDFCDCEKENGVVCNRTPEFVIKDNDVETYLCNECFYMYESPEGSQAFCISQI